MLVGENKLLCLLRGGDDVTGQRQDAFVDGIEYPRGLREEVGLHFDGRRDPVARAEDDDGRVEVVEGELAEVARHGVQE